MKFCKIKKVNIIKKKYASVDLFLHEVLKNSFNDKDANNSLKEEH